MALSRIFNGAPLIIDYVNYPALGPDRSYGSDPAGQNFVLRQFSAGTPGSTNSGPVGADTISINEWMASNTNFIANSIGGQYDDWFELYNYGNSPVNLAGYYLSDTATNKNKFQIPAGYGIPAHGFLLVWADKQTSTGSGDLHVNFKLSKSGSNLGLYKPDGTTIDSGVFGAQLSDISQGRFPDADSKIYFMENPTPRTSNRFSSPAPERLVSD